jgi:hypothetical protein
MTLSDSLRRYRLILPAEHGSWSLALVPFLIGAGVAGQITPALGLCLIAVLGLFLARQPILLGLRSMRGRAREGDDHAAVVWSAILSSIAALAGIGMLALGVWEALWLAIPAAGVLILTLILTTWFGQRQLLIELIGGIGLALSAPAAYAAVSGHLDQIGWLAFGVCALHNLISLLYVRHRIDLKHGRASEAQGWISAGAHLAALAAVSGGVLLGWFNWLVVVPFAGLLMRAIWTTWTKPDLPHVKRFGFTEIGLAIVAAGFIIAGLRG